MLRELRIQNFVLIENLTLSFSEGFNVLTGETGAGKSILVGAISLLLGGRASPDLVRSGEDEAHIEALFELFPGRETDEIKEILVGSGLPYENGKLILRRIINRNGKGKVYINGSFANLTTLVSVGKTLIEIHGQHSHHTLTDAAVQLRFLDSHSNAGFLFKEYTSHYKRLLSAQQEKAELEATHSASIREEEFIRYQLNEIDSAKLSVEEEENLLKEEKLLRNGEEITLLTHEAHTVLGSEEGVLNTLGKVATQLEALCTLGGEGEETQRLFQDAYVGLKEVARNLARESNLPEFSPMRLEKVAEQLHAIGRLKRKYGGSVEAVLAYREELTNSLSKIHGKEEHLTKLENCVQKEERNCRELAQRLSVLRNKGAVVMEEKMASELASLKMGKTHFKIGIEPVALHKGGSERVEFLISLPEEPPKSIGKVASGGELSRIMLAIKVTLSSLDSNTTLIFDEIDAGIGGGIAEKVGKRLKRLSEHHQVFCVTHLPQIASFADQHFSVEKREMNGKMRTEVVLLEKNERVEEIARMLGGEKLTQTTRMHAKEMITTNLKVKR